MRWTLGLAVLALAIFGATDARALTAYVSEGKDACCASKGKACHDMTACADHHVGSFDLAGIAPDKAGSATCSTKAGACKMQAAACPVGTTAKHLAEIASGPFILTGAVLNDAYLILTMPYRQPEPLNG